MKNLDAITTQLRQDYRNRRIVRDKLWLLAFTAVAMVAYIAFYATR